MMGHTHLAVGVAAGLAIFVPKTWPELLAGIGAGALGGAYMRYRCRYKQIT